MTNDKDHIDLDKLKRNDSLKAPEGYFDSLSDRIHQRINASKNVAGWREFVSDHWIKIAAAVLTIVLITSLLINTKTPTAQEILADVDDQDIYQYLLNEELEDDQLLSRVDLNSQVDLLLDEAFDEIDETYANDLKGTFYTDTVQ